MIRNGIKQAKMSFCILTGEKGTSFVTYRNTSNLLGLFGFCKDTVDWKVEEPYLQEYVYIYIRPCCIHKKKYSMLIYVSV